MATPTRTSPSLFTEGLTSTTIDRGRIYYLLTSRPDNRRPLTWERNQIELLMLGRHYNHEQPHSGLGYRTPEEFGALCEPDRVDMRTLRRS